MTSTPDCQTKTPRQSSLGCVETAKDNVQIFGRQLNDGGDWRIFPRRGISVSFFHKDVETYIVVHGDDFFIVGQQEVRGVCTEFAARCIRAEQSCGFLGRTAIRPFLLGPNLLRPGLLRPRTTLGKFDEGQSLVENCNKNNNFNFNFHLNYINYNNYNFFIIIDFGKFTIKIMTVVVVVVIIIIYN